jgi:glycosyltransferase involved in cell wall biosynthesis
MKHNPEILVALAREVKSFDHVRVVVITEGLGAEYLAQQKARLGLDNLLLFPFQPFEQIPLVQAAADVLMAILEPDAGVFAVPSKVLTYLCAKRSLLLAIPLENLAARTVHEKQAGLLVPPHDIKGFVQAALTLLHDDTLRRRLADNGRRYAENHFDIEKITDRFEQIFTRITP